VARALLLHGAVQIPVGYQATTSKKGVRHFRCRTCGHRQEAEVTGIGIGTESFLNARGTARRRAHDNARKEIDRTIRFAACPKCGQRGRHLAFIAPYLGMTAFFVALGVIFGYAPTWFDINMSAHDKAICATYVTWAFVIAAVLAGGLPLWFRWSHNDGRVKWISASPTEADPTRSAR
jgi:hypothetical protein